MINCFSLKNLRGWKESLAWKPESMDGKQHTRVEMAGTDHSNKKKTIKKLYLCVCEKQMPYYNQFLYDIMQL